MKLGRWLFLPVVAVLVALLAPLACGGLDYQDVDDPGATIVDDDSADDDTTLDDDTAGDDDIADDDDTGDDDSTPGDDDDDDDTPYDPSSFSVTFFDVGLGDAALFGVPGGYTVLVDGGAPSEGQFTICPELEARGIDYLDVMVVTHPQYDHFGGLTEVFDCVEVGELWTNGEQNPDSEGYRLFRDRVLEWDGPIVVKHEGEIDNLGLLFIGTYHSAGDFVGFDNNGLVQLFEYMGMRVLMTADVRTEAQEAIALEQGANLQADVVKIPDHGLVYSPAFLALLDADYGLLSVGPNTMGYPTPETVAAYLATGLDLYRTDVHGTVQFALEGDTITVDATN
jgi:beta-lactamase superfamily II metal-dependent hydrolase